MLLLLLPPCLASFTEVSSLAQAKWGGGLSGGVGIGASLERLTPGSRLQHIEGPGESVEVFFFFLEGSLSALCINKRDLLLSHTFPAPKPSFRQSCGRALYIAPSLSHMGCFQLIALLIIHRTTDTKQGLMSVS